MGDATTLAGTVLAAASLLSLLVGFPQAVRLWRTRDAAGIATAHDLLRVVGKVLWLTFALSVADLGLAATQLLVAVPSAVTVALLVRAGQLRRDQVLGPCTLTACAAAGAVAAGAGMLVGWAATGLDLVRYVPQLRETFSASSLSGVSASTFALQGATSVMWGVYGALTGTWPLVVGNAVLLPVVAVIWWRVTADHNKCVPAVRAHGH